MTLKIIVIIAAVIILPLLYISMRNSGYSWRQALGFDVMITIIFLVIVMLLELNSVRKEFIDHDDNYYDN